MEKSTRMTGNEPHTPGQLTTSADVSVEKEEYKSDPLRIFELPAR